jgi:Putative Ig domain
MVLRRGILKEAFEPRSTRLQPSSRKDRRCGGTLALIIGMAIVGFFSFSASALAATNIVTSANDSGTGSLREVIEDANGGDKIVFDASLNDQTINLASAIVIDKSLTLEGLGASHLTIDGNHTSQIFIVSAGDLSISRLTLANGATPGNGGAINYESTGSLIISDSTFTGNTAGGAGSTGGPHGGAIYMLYQSASLTISGSTFTDNSAGGDGNSNDYSGRSRGGAIEYDGEGSVTITDSAFTGNTAGGDGGDGYQSGYGHGGAIYLLGSAASTSVSDSTFTNNSAGGDGGGGNISGRGEGGAIEGESGTGPLTITGATFTDNVAGGRDGSGGGSGAGVGGAIESFSALTVANSTFSGNAAGGQGGSGEGAFGFGGAISNFNNVSPLTVTESTFVGNTAGGQGGSGSGGAIRASSASPRSASVTNSTLIGNSAGGGGATGEGGAINLDGKVSATLASVTIDENEVGAGGAGAGIDGAAAVTARATIVSGNTGATNCNAHVATSSYSLEGPSSGDTSCGFDLPSADPQLEPLADNGGPTETQALPVSSPAVDAVPVVQCPTKVDQRGEPRPDNGKSVCDVGAFELQDPPVAPTVTSAAAATFQTGKAGSFTVTATGLPIPDLSLIGALPSGVSFTDNGDGTASLSGTPAVGTGGTYPITIKASNGTLPDAEQSFTLTVQAPPTASIATPVDGATYTQGQAVSASFVCAEGTGGPGIASCVDQDGRPSGMSLDTAAIGQHTFTVTATSKDGLTSRTSVTYTIVPTSKAPPRSPRPGVLVSYRQEGGIGGPRPSLVVFKDRRARVTLGRCTAKFDLRPRAWSRLRAALKDAHLHAIAGNYPAPKGSVDVITYVIKAGGEVVRIAPPQPEHKEVMRDLRPLLKVLNKLVSAGERRMPPSCKSSR